MNQRKAYTGIDIFRVVAALMVIAVHTSPLASFSDTADFFLTRVLCRVAVPFFFMTSGFFLISSYSENAEACKRFVRRTGYIYLATILLYLPINVYNHYFTTEHLLPRLLKDLFFDGTLYHLWYLPASILGAIIAYAAVKRFGFSLSLIGTGILYLIGLFGDNYYGFVYEVAPFNAFYNALFGVFDYTRNGLFFAPFFFVLGGYISKREKTKKTLSPAFYCLGTALSLVALLAEAWLLRSSSNVTRHDSMYFMLVPLMYFLFRSLLFLRGKRLTVLRTSALLIYILHPMVIVALRLAAKVLHEQIFIHQSMLHFLAVTVLTLSISVVCVILYERMKKPVTYSGNKHRAWIELNLSHLTHNVKELYRIMPPHCELMAILKAEAYGHGAYPVSSALHDLGIKAFAVATIDEGISLRKYGLRGEILILGYTDPRRASELHRYRLSQTVFDTTYAKKLSAQKRAIQVHIAIDSGMHRLGIPYDRHEEVLSLFDDKYLMVKGVFTHLCAADSEDPGDVSYTERQIASFSSLLEALKGQGIKLPKIHIQSSYGLINYPALSCDYARIGISLYGVDSADGLPHKTVTDFRPVLSLRTKVIQLRDVDAGTPVGYGRAFVTERPTRLAVLPIGYADGLPRSLSGGTGQVIICGQKASIVGRVCMDQVIVDVTDIPDVSLDSIATLIGKDGDAFISAEEVASQAGTITNELLSRLGRRLTIQTIE